MNGPLPFLFGLKAAQAEQRYHLSLGSMHWPQGRVEKLADGTTKNWPPQLHIVAVPKLEVDAREWCRAEVQLDARTSCPQAIRLLNPQKTMETVYLLPSENMKVNAQLDDQSVQRPAAVELHLGEASRATNDETPVSPPSNDAAPSL